jgi:pimeloyl-ACP methyl ester carboxylesterase
MLRPSLLRRQPCFSPASFCRDSFCSLRVSSMNRRLLLQTALALLLCALGYYLAHRESYEVHAVLASAGGCQMATDIYEPRSGTPVGSVVLFHGLAANKKVMAFNAQEFANQDLRVFVPDLPGHGRTPGPYSPDRDDSCALAFVRDLAARKAIIPERTILSGHSLGAAIAIRAASHFPVAGVIAFSPAPMQTTAGFSAEMIPFHDVLPLPPHSLLLTGQWEPGPIKALAQQLVATAADSSSMYQMIPTTTHVSILFSAQTFAQLRAWTAQILGTNPEAPFPKTMPALACILGIIGLAILVPPFLHEMNVSCKTNSPVAAPAQLASTGIYLRGLWTILLASFAVMLLLTTGHVPFHFVRIFQCDYLGVFLFFSGIAALAATYKLLPPWSAFCNVPALSATASAIVITFLFAAWFELTFYEAWLNPARWSRFPLLFLLLLPAHLAEELFLGEPRTSPNRARILKAFGLRAAAVAALSVGIFTLHSGEILFALLSSYFVVFSLLQRLACDLVRFRTQSPAATAIFGAILLAAFALAIFPVA